MYNLLRSNYTQAFTTADKAADNAGGGIALWEVPDEMRCAFNPIIVTRTKYLHLIIGSYEPSYSPVPCYIIQSAPRQVAFPYALATSIRVCVHLVDDTYAVAKLADGKCWRADEFYNKLSFSMSLKYLYVPCFNSSVASSSHTMIAWGCCCKQLIVHMWLTGSSTP